VIFVGGRRRGRGGPQFRERPVRHGLDCVLVLPNPLPKTRSSTPPAPSPVADTPSGRSGEFPRIDGRIDPRLVEGAALLSAGLGVWLVIVLVRNAWISDDAFITYRIVDNFVHGRGMTWNPGQRVQAFTHPAWFFLMSAAYAITRELYFTALVLSIGISCAALWLACTKLARGAFSAVPFLAALLFSRSIVDYSTSGLENPLANLLLVVWLWLLARHPGRAISPWFDVVTGLIVFNRLDSALIVLPVWSWVLYRRFAAKGLRNGVLPALLRSWGPLSLWLAFATFYFGFPLPNTAYAKLGVGIPAAERIQQGLLYVLQMVADDPVSAVVLGLGLGYAWLGREFWQRLVVIGALLYLGYVVWIGGDFMAGRFFTMPLMIAAAALLRMRGDPASSITLAMVLAAAGAFGPAPPPLSGRLADARIEPRRGEKIFGVVDERRFRFPELGLMQVHRGVEMPQGKRREQGIELAGRPGDEIQGAGIRGFYAGPKTPLVEIYALTDPFLARLPASIEKDWIMGHFEREIPDGYADSLRTGKNLVKDRKLRALYEEIRIVTQGPLWSWRRFHGIVRLNSGAYDALAKR
jgi:arabinofuranosyltransferase